MRFVTRSDVRSRLEGKRVAIVGSGPGVLDNEPGFVDGHDVVVRVNNYKLSEPTGFRTDVFYSFFGASITKTAEELKRDGVTLCCAKCPNAHAIDSEWHRAHGKMMGVDFRWIYQRRADWWFCDTFVPSTEEFLKVFDLLDRHVPTTGFAAILEVLSCEPREVYLTGFDFFRSGIHNVNERWQKKNPEDPIGHVPERELAWLAANWKRHPIVCDPALTAGLEAALRGDHPFQKPAARLLPTG
jgi:hypothetical protein